MKVDAVQEEFEEFHRENAEVYVYLVKLAREMVRRGYDEIGIGHLYEVLRWRVKIATKADPDYYQPDGKPLKLANAHRARYARLIMKREPDLAEIFRTAELRTRRLRVIDPLEPGEQARLW
jgi:hypothetical protein